VNFTLTLF